MAVYNIGDFDNVNPENGNLFLNISLLSYPQRGKHLRLTFRIYYNDKAWFIVPTQAVPYAPNGSHLSGTWSWFSFMDQSQPDNLGVYVARDQHVDFGDDVYQDVVIGGGEPYSQYQITTHLDGYYLRGSDGSKHYYGDDQEQSCSTVGGGASCPQTFSGFKNFYSATDGTGYLPLNFSEYGGSTSVVDADGVTYTLSLTGKGNTITDRSGNTITADTSGWHDTLGRSIPGSYTGPGTSDASDSSSYWPTATDPIPGVPVSPNQTTCPATTTAARQWVVPSVGSGATQIYYLCYQPYTFQTAFNLPTPSGPWAAVFDTSSSDQGFRPAVLLSNIMLPNGTSYAFSYDNYLSLSSITLPTGATISYTWQNVTFDQSNAVPISRALATRTVNPGNGEPSQTWHYQWIETANTLPTWSIITDPNGNDTEYQLGGTDDAGNTLLSPSSAHRMYYLGCGPHDTSSFCSGPSTLLRTVGSVMTAYGSGGADPGTPSAPIGLVQPTTTTTTWNLGGGGSLISKTVMATTPAYGTCAYWGRLDNVSGGVPEQPERNSYTPCYAINQPQSVAVYDYGSGAAGPLLRTITTNYAWQLNGTSNSYFSANLLSLPENVVTTDGNGSKVAETDYNYDESPSPSGVYGNLTSVVQWRNTGNSPVYSTQYNTQGMPTVLYDPKLSKTTITYDSTGAFPQLIQRPSTGGVSHNDQYIYDSNTGLLLSHTDDSGNKTTYTYNDPLNRLKQITYPITTDGTTGNSGQGGITYNYTDTPGSLAVAEQQLQSTSDALVTHTSQFDGLGRILHSFTSDSQGTVIVDTTYDLLGKVHSVSNPYRTTSDPTYGTTVFSYDPLGRKTSQLQPGSGTLQWCYNDLATSGQSNCLPNASSKTGTWVDFSDESGRHWQRVSDALGRLIAVMEPDASSTPKLETDYFYNGLNNLTSVKQVGSSGETQRTRSFAYDSLSRLIAALNPETSSASNPPSLTCLGATGTWTTCYSYDANGNLTSKTDNRNLTTSYFYDALNRLTGKTYSDANTPSSCYEYDLALGKDTGTNQVGRLVSEWTQPGTCPLSSNAIPSSAINWKYITSYDSMGRILSEQQCPLAPCSNPTPISYGYDLAGNLTNSTNGMPPSSVPITLTYTPDAAGRLAKLTSSWNDATHPQTLFEADASTANALSAPAAYSPFGGLEAALYGISSTTNVAGLSDIRSYDSRARLVSKSVLGIPATSVVLSMNMTTFTTADDAVASVHVGCNSACGQVQFAIDGHQWGVFNLDGSGNASVSVYWYPSPYFTPGAHTITANYLGNSTYPPFSKSISVTVSPIGTQQPSVSLSIAPTTFTTAENAVASVHVGCNSACGVVQFAIDGHQWVVFDLDSSGNISVGTYWWPSSYFTPGTHTLTANYLGNSTYAPTSQSVSLTINPIGTQQTSESLSIAPTAFATVENALVSVHVGCNSSCGQVQFEVDGHQWVVFGLDSNGNTSIDTFWWESSSFTTGTHTLTANYLGNSTYAPTSQSVPFTINPIGTQPVSVSLSVNPATTFSASGEFSFPVHVSCNSACGFVKVTVDGNQWVLSQPDQSGNILVDKTWAGGAYFTAGAHTVIAHFLGSSTYAPSDSSALTVTVTP